MTSRPISQDRMWVGFGALASGLGALAFALVATRALGLEGFAPVAQLWTVWSLSAATITFAVQQVVAHAVHLGGLRVGWTPMLLVGSVALVAFTTTWALREDLFYSSALWWPVACGLVPFGSYVTGLARGRVASQRAPWMLALVVGGENLVRVLVGSVLLLVHASPGSFGIAIFAGFLVAVIGSRNVSPDRATRSLPGSPRTTLAASVAGLTAHSLLVLAPPGIALANHQPAAVSGVFILLAIYRAPYQLILGIAPYVASRLGAAMAKRDLARVRVSRATWVRIALLLTATLGAMAFLGALAVTPVVGARDVLTAVDHVLAAGLTVVVGAGILATMVLISGGQQHLVLVAWPLPAGAALTYIVAGGAASITAALVVLNLAGLASLTALGWRLRPTRSP